MTIVLNGTTGIQNVLGSAAAPAESNTTSSNTGLYFPTSTTLGLSTAGTNAVYIDASQNVGIGTTSPTGKLNVNGGSYDSLTVSGNSTNSVGMRFQNSAASSRNWNIGSSGGGPSPAGTFFIYDDTGSATRMVIDSSGNVGIGTSAPGTKLDVSGAIRATGTSAILAFSKRSTGTGDAWGMYSQSGEYNIYDYTASVSRLVIDTSGNLLVGTTSSNGRLAVDGAGATSATYAVYVRNSTPSDLFYLRNDGFFSTGGAASSPYNSTTATAANVVVQSNGQLQRSTSSLKYKTDVQDATHGLADVLKLRAVTYKGKNDGDTIFGGFIAEEVHEAGLAEFVQYAKDGSPDALNYGNMVSLAFKAIQEQQALITTLTARIEALEAK